MVAERPASAGSPPAAKEAALLPVALEALAPLSTGLAVIYGLLMPLHLVQLEGRSRLLIVVAEALLVVVFLAQRLAIARSRLGRRQVQFLAAGTAALPFLSVLLLFALRSDPFYTGFVLVILIGCGAFFLSAVWLGVALVAISTTWVAVVHAAVPAIDELQMTAVLLAAVTLSVVVFVSRRRNLRTISQALARVERELAQREASERTVGVLSRAVEQSSSIVLITDPAGDIQYVNPKFTRATGYAAEEVIGRNPRLLQSGETPQEVYADLWATIAGGGEWHGELNNKTKSGEPLWVLASISPVSDEEGRIISYLGVQEDITARKRAEQKLLQSQRLEAVGQLVSGVAHDFNNLLTSIVGFSQLAMATLPVEGESCRGYLEQVIGAGDSAARLTRQLLAVGRQQLLRPRVLDPNAEIRRSEELLRRTLGEDIEVVMSLDPEVGQVQVDSAQLQQVLLNLAINARDAMPRGGVLTFETTRVEIGASYVASHPGARPGSFVMLAASDTGCGMDERTLKRIFEPFFTTKKPGRGSGLGLATSYGIIKQSGGYIWAYSEPGKGSTFKIYLPRCSGLTAEQLEGAPVRSDGGSETILLVEDADHVRKLLTEFLAQEGYTVLAAPDSKEALEIAAENGGIDLLITDLVLPTDNGLLLAERLGAGRGDLKLLLISGYAESALRRKHALDPEVPLLAKPFTMQDLATTVRRILDGPEPHEPRDGYSR